MKFGRNSVAAITLILSLVLLQCTGDGVNKEAKVSSERKVNLDSASPITLISVIQEGDTASFLMGSTDEEVANQPSMDHPDFYTDDEQPAHKVVLTIPYKISKYEITNDQYCDVMNYAIEKGLAIIKDGDLYGTDGRLYLGITHLDTSAKYLGVQYGIEIDSELLKPVDKRETEPAHGVTWYGAIAFCNFLSEMKNLSPTYDLEKAEWDKTKYGFRLPTEAEWEYAARGDKRYIYSWGNEIDKRHLNYFPSQTGEYYSATGRFNKSVFKPVGFYNGELRDSLQTIDSPSPFGLYDMTGNVWEWCWDWYGREYYKNASTHNPSGPQTGDDRPPYDIERPTKVWRGCGWAGNEAFSRITKRWSSNPEMSINEVGFRIARTIL